jgi:hypothetical protein
MCGLRRDREARIQAALFLRAGRLIFMGSPRRLRSSDAGAQRRRGAAIQYADLSDLMLMMDMRVGGGIMAVVNEGQALVEPRSIPPILSDL